MKITLEYPYTTLYKSGYLSSNRENRKTIYLVKRGEGTTKSSTSYARYLMSVYLKRFLNKDETVDHIDGDKTNDVIDNLQILSIADNIKKSSKGRTMVTLTCPWCKQSFTREKKQTYLTKGGVHTFCSKYCSGIYGSTKRWASTNMI